MFGISIPNDLLWSLYFLLLIAMSGCLVKLSVEARKAAQQLQSPNADPELVKVSVKTAKRTPYVVGGVMVLIFGALRATDVHALVEVMRFGVVALFIVTWWLGFRLYRKRYLPIIWAATLSLGLGATIGFVGATCLGL